MAHDSGRRLARSFAALALGATGCAALPFRRWDDMEGPPRLLAAIEVSPVVDAELSRPGVRGYCAIGWKRVGDTLTLASIAPSQDAVSVRCNGEPVVLARPQCTLTSHEALLYAATTPIVAIRCPYGGAGYITGFSKAQRGRS